MLRYPLVRRLRLLVNLLNLAPYTPLLNQLHRRPKDLRNLQAFLLIIIIPKIAKNIFGLPSSSSVPPVVFFGVREDKLLTGHKVKLLIGHNSPPLEDDLGRRSKVFEQIFK